MAYIKNEDVGVFAYLTAEAETTVITAETYYPAVGTFTNDPQECFSVTADPAIQCDCNTPRKYEIDWSVTCSGNSNRMTIHYGFKKYTQATTSWAMIDSSIMGNFFKTANEAGAISGTTIVDLAEGDRIQIILTADGDGDKVKTMHYTTTIRRFFER